MMYTIEVIYILTSGFSLLFCNGFFVLFHLHQRKKEYSQQSNCNDDFLLSCQGHTIQIGSVYSAIRLYTMFSAWQNQFLTCFLLNLRVLNIQIQLFCMLLFSLTRFAKLFYPKQFSKMNHYLTGILIKIFIILGPAYINFVTGHICGLDIFCPKDLRDSYNLIGNTGILDYQEEMVSVIMETLECRTNLSKHVLPPIIFLYLLLNLCIILKELSRILLPLRIVTPEALEVRTVSAIVENAEASEDEQPQNSDHAEYYSVGVMTGVLTILAISLGKVLSLMILQNKISNLMLLMVEMILRILIPLLWFVRNTAIIRTQLD